jgi:uncharacterized protein involved in tolerance to divalent cations
MAYAYYEVFISAENQKQADKILNSLLNKKLVTGGQFLQSAARFLWKGKINEMEYNTITSFTRSDKKQAVIKDIESTSEEEVPMVRFITIELNQKLARWIDETLGKE